MIGSYTHPKDARNAVIASKAMVEHFKSTAWERVYFADTGSTLSWLLTAFMRSQADPSPFVPVGTDIQGYREVSICSSLVP